MSESKATTERKSPGYNLGHRTYYINRELSWLEFNRRVLEEALDENNRLLERVKFLAIFSSNLDEFFMIRISGLKGQLDAGALKAPPDGMTPGQQLAEIRERLKPLLESLSDCWHNDLLPRLRKDGINILAYDDLKSKQRKLLRRHFRSEIFPVLTPLAFDPGHPFPHISNLSVNLAVTIREPNEGERFARVKIPNVPSRLLRVPSEEKADEYERLGLKEPAAANFVWIEDVVMANLDLLFPGLEVLSAYPFRVTRDADFEIEEDEAADLLSTMQEVVGKRHFGSAVRLEVDARMPERIRNVLLHNLELSPFQVYEVEGPLGHSSLMEMLGIERPELKDEPFLPFSPPAFASEESIFSTLRERDVLLYHPYDSFNPVIEFIRSAASDPHVVAIKQTLYRVGPNSPIVQALMEARENGKQVAAMVELKARFDEENNIVWARALEQAGVHVVYGLLGLKTHAKMCLVVRRERDGVRRYVHLGTGNYNPVTARIYTDLGYLTSNEEIGADVSDLFNSLTGYSLKQDYRKIIVSPQGTRRAIIDRIDQVRAHHREKGGGHIAFKMNSLVDKACIRALYEASQAGVKIDLQVRGICCLRPRVPGVSENIDVTSVVGRFLEHSRIYYFRAGDTEEMLLGSADLMPRNLDGRVEVLFPIEDAQLLRAIRDDILFLHLRDTVKSRKLLANGTYKRRKPEKGFDPLDTQSLRLEKPGSWHRESEEG